VENTFREKLFVKQLRQFMKRSEKLGSKEEDKQPFLSILKEKYLKKRAEEILDKFNILLMWYGVSENEDRMNCNVHKILQSGLANYSKNENGRFGRGVYSTSYSRYAAMDSMGINGENLPNRKNEYVLLLCAVAVGNVYVISRETDYIFTNKDGKRCYNRCKKKVGKDLKDGYDAHYACLSTKRSYDVPPCTEADETDCDELVVASEDQMLPICKVYFKKATLNVD